MSEVFAGRMGYDRPVDGGTRARRAPVPFDPSMPEAGRCRRWLSAGLRDRGIPPDSRLDLALRPHGEVSVARLQLDLRRADADSERHAHAEGADPAPTPARTGLARLAGRSGGGQPAPAARLIEPTDAAAQDYELRKILSVRPRSRNGRASSWPCPL